MPIKNQIQEELSIPYERLQDEVPTPYEELQYEDSEPSENLQNEKNLIEEGSSNRFKKVAILFIIAAVLATALYIKRPTEQFDYSEKDIITHIEEKGR